MSSIDVKHDKIQAHENNDNIPYLKSATSVLPLSAASGIGAAHENSTT
jgi:hypothetical protein